jgi:hypothetical protein
VDRSDAPVSCKIRLSNSLQWSLTCFARGEPKADADGRAGEDTGLGFVLRFFRRMQEMAGFGRFEEAENCRFPDETYSRRPIRLGKGQMMADWFCLKDGQQVGPISTGKLHELAISGELIPEDMISKAGANAWIAAGSVNGLFGGQSEGKADKTKVSLCRRRDWHADRRRGRHCFDLAWAGDGLGGDFVLQAHDAFH